MLGPESRPLVSYKLVREKRPPGRGHMTVRVCGRASTSLEWCHRSHDVRRGWGSPDGGQGSSMYKELASQIYCSADCFPV